LLEKAEWEELVSNSAKDVATWKGAYLQLKRQLQQHQQQSGIEQFIGSISYSGVGNFSATNNNDLNESNSLLLEESNSFLSSNRGKKVSGAASVISQASSSVAHHAKTMLTCGSNGGR